jgi:predicted transcriptional regulator
MTKDQINDVLERVRTWPEEQQAYAVEVLLAIEAQQGELLRVSDEEWAAIQEGSAQAERGEFVSDEEMAAFWKRHDR